MAVTIYTKNMDCDKNRMKVYGHEMSSRFLVVDDLTDDYSIAAIFRAMKLCSSSNRTRIFRKLSTAQHQLCFSCAIGKELDK